MNRPRWILAAAALPVFMAAEARAGYTFSTTITPTSQAIGTQSTIGFQGATGPAGPTLSGAQDISLAGVIDTTTQSPATTDTGSVPFSITITITQGGSDPAGTGMLTLTGTLTFTRSDTGGEISSEIVPSGSVSTTIQGVTYSISESSLVYTQPTVNQGFGTNGAGGISALVTVVPEPSSLAALAVGGLLLVAPRLRRLTRRLAKS
jgi:hypothetical protein